MSKKQLILLLILFVSITSLAFYQRQVDSKRTTPTVEKFSETSVAQTDKIQISKNNSPATILQKTGSNWNIISPITAEADQEKINDILTRTKTLEKGDQISDKKEKFSQFNVDEHGSHVEFFQNNKKILGFYVGKMSDDYVSTFIRNDTEDTVYLTKGILESVFSQDAEALRNKMVVQVNEADVAEVLLKKEDKKRSFIQKNATWESTPASALSQNAIKEKIRTLLQIRAASFPLKDHPTHEDMLKNFDIKVFIKRTNSDLKSTVLYIKKDSSATYGILEDKQDVFTLDSSLIQTITDILS